MDINFKTIMINHSTINTACNSVAIEKISLELEEKHSFTNTLNMGGKGWGQVYMIMP